jgi:hypothetical protein
LSRLFTFGCSFTQYHWPTWADILGSEFDHYENWGLAGGGNHFIFNSLNECILKNKLSKDDTVIIMWSDTNREDRYVSNKWLVSGNIYHQTTYDDEFVKKFADLRGYLIRDLAFIHSAKKLLEFYNIKHYFLSMVPIGFDLDNKMATTSENFDVINLYKEILDFIRPSIYEVVFNYDWKNRPLVIENSKHELNTELEKNYTALSGVDWPNLDNYLKRNFNNLKKSILEEINNFETTIKKNFRTDLHPIPSEHLEYISKILPEFTISDSTKDWIMEIDQIIINGVKDYKDIWIPQNLERL